MDWLKSHLLCPLHSRKNKGTHQSHATAPKVSLLDFPTSLSIYSIFMAPRFILTPLLMLIMLILRVRTIIYRAQFPDRLSFNTRNKPWFKASTLFPLLADYSHTIMWEWRILSLSLHHTTFILAFQQLMSHSIHPNLQTTLF